MLTHIWTVYLFQPVFNLLVYFYNELTNQNLGVAVIYLTLLLRFVLLPFSLINVWNEGFYKKISKDISKIALAYKDDPVLQNQEIREFLRHHRINPWAKAIVLGVQALTLVLLYQVFLGGIHGSKFDLLYPQVERPDFINTQFLGFDIGSRSILWPAIVAIFLFLEVSWEQRKKKKLLMNSDVVYKVLFPLIIFIVLAVLPLVKSIFILTSLIFSLIVVGGARILFGLIGSSKDNEEVPVKESD